jgi:hypothetical protein
VVDDREDRTDHHDDREEHPADRHQPPVPAPPAGTAAEPML